MFAVGSLPRKSALQSRSGIARALALFVFTSALALSAGGCGDDARGGTHSGTVTFTYGSVWQLDMASGDFEDRGFQGYSPVPLGDGRFVYVTRADELVVGDAQGATGEIIVPECSFCDRLALNADETRIVHDQLGDVPPGGSNNWVVVRDLAGTALAQWPKMMQADFLPNGGVIMVGMLPENRGLWVTGPDLGEPERLDDLLDDPRAPSVSPDGQTIAFVYQDHIWSIPSGGGAATRLTEADVALADWPTWSPDGSEIAFQSTGSIAVIPATGGAAEDIRNSVGNVALAESAMDWR